MNAAKSVASAIAACNGLRQEFFYYDRMARRVELSPRLVVFAWLSTIRFKVTRCYSFMVE